MRVPPTACPAPSAPLLYSPPPLPLSTRHAEPLRLGQVTSGTAAQIRIENVDRLKPEEIDRMVQDAAKFKQADDEVPPRRPV